MLMLRGPQTAAELRLNCERLHRFADISSVEAFLDELAGKTPPRALKLRACARRARGPLGPPAVREPAQPAEGRAPAASADGPLWTSCAPNWPARRPSWPRCGPS
jgi:hypothetical protein